MDFSQTLDENLKFNKNRDFCRTVDEKLTFNEKHELVVDTS